jgi:hypothetical protein
MCRGDRGLNQGAVGRRRGHRAGEQKDDGAMICDSPAFTAWFPWSDASGGTLAARISGLDLDRAWTRLDRGRSFAYDADLADRLEAQCDPMTVLVCDDTWRQVRDEFTLADPGLYELKEFGGRRVFRLDGEIAPDGESRDALPLRSAS